ncbi:hypothetical protein ADEAN_000162400 [Angomonas deanei]|uniref:RNA editing complex protein MP67 n=1 Tax=Angomonas deanei TaxID=59799 RepID=A0A7G2C3C0_9TRYP|nr:hypothetical protein ADEAN_000162400 [Angomonas deanei]
MLDAADKEVEKATTDTFYNSRDGVCALCGGPIAGTFSRHATFVEHRARVGIVKRSIALVDYFLIGSLSHVKTVPVPDFALCSPKQLNKLRNNVGYASKIDFVKGLVHYWWGLLDAKEGDCDFGRCASLSSTNSTHRLWRVQYLLRYLYHCGLLQGSLHISGGGPDGKSFSRSGAFECFELVGDHIIKSQVPDRLRTLFPPHLGGVVSDLLSIQQMLDSNNGLIDIYNYLNLNKIIGTTLPASKCKADVVEALFGELQCLLWSAENSRLGEEFPDVQFSGGLAATRALVEHTLNELTHVVVMWQIEATLHNVRMFIQNHAIETANRQNVLLSKGEKQSAAPRERSALPSPMGTLPVMTADSVQKKNVTAKRGAVAFRSYAVTTPVGNCHRALRQLSSAPCPLLPSLGEELLIPRDHLVTAKRVSWAPSSSGNAPPAARLSTPDFLPRGNH